LTWKRNILLFKGGDIPPVAYRIAAPDPNWTFLSPSAILDAWSRKVVGYAISRSMDARVAVAALKAAIRSRNPPKGCIHHSVRGSQYVTCP
jgi:transposase InsO family protein